MTEREQESFTRWKGKVHTFKQARTPQVHVEGLHLRLDDGEAFDHAEFCRAYARGLRVVREIEADASR